MQERGLQFGQVPFKRDPIVDFTARAGIGKIESGWRLPARLPMGNRFVPRETGRTQPVSGGRRGQPDGLSGLRTVL